MNDPIKPLPHDGRSRRASNPPSVGRRAFVKGAMAGLGATTAGVASTYPVAAAVAASPDPSRDGSLRALTWTGADSAMGLVGIGADEVRIRPLRLHNNELQFSGEELARIPVGPGPVAIGTVPESIGSFLVVRTVLETAGQYTTSYDLDADMRQFFFDEGVGLDEYPTVGSISLDLQQVTSEPILMNSTGAIIQDATIRSLWKEVQSGAHYEPISTHQLENRWIIFLATSGANRLEVSIPEEIVGVELSGSDASVTGVYSIGKFDGHSSRGPAVIELSKTRVAFVFAYGDDNLHIIGYDLATKEAKNESFAISDLPNTRRILQHDRLVASGRARSWIAEVLPGSYSLETMEGESLWPA